MVTQHQGTVPVSCTAPPTCLAVMGMRSGVQPSSLCARCWDMAYVIGGWRLGDGFCSSHAQHEEHVQDGEPPGVEVKDGHQEVAQNGQLHNAPARHNTCQPQRSVRLGQIHKHAGLISLSYSLQTERQTSLTDIACCLWPNIHQQPNAESRYTQGVHMHDMPALALHTCRAAVTQAEPVLAVQSSLA